MQNTFDDQIAFPVIAQTVEKAPVNFTPTFITNKFLLAEIVFIVGNFRDACEQCPDRPLWMNGEIQKLARANVDRGLKAIALFPGARGQNGYIHGKHYRFVAANSGPIHHIKSHFFGLSDIELKPGMGSGTVERLLNAAGGHG